MSLETRFYENINEFYDIAFPFLLKKEVENGLQLSILNSLKKNIERYGEEPPVLCTVNEGDDIKLVSLRTPPYNQILSYTDKLETIDILVNALIIRNDILPGVLGFKEGVERFTNLWCEKMGLKSQITMNERLYSLKKVVEETLGNNKFIKALPDRSLEMIERSLKHFRKDIHEGSMFLLFDNDLPVSMARRSGKSVNGIAVNLVYTPPSLRRNGYATECVAKLSNLLLEEGNKFCFLFTDLSNPTSNSIYQKIGYRPIIDVDEYHFI